MDLIKSRFGNNLSFTLSQNRLRHRQFVRLKNDIPTGICIQTRAKTPTADLRRGYGSRLTHSSLLGGLLLTALFSLYPEHHPTVSLLPRPPAVFAVQDIPETHQTIRPPAQPRPQVPLAVEGDEVPEDVTIESTELDFDHVSVDIQLALGPVSTGEISSEPIDYLEIDYKPHPRRIVTPEYPKEARHSRTEGRVIVRVLVSEEGQVEKVDVISGPEIFHDAARKAAEQFRFHPGKHKGERRKVWMVMPIDFLLK